MHPPSATLIACTLLGLPLSGSQEPSTDPHAEHRRHLSAPTRYARTEHRYELPAVTLLDRRGEPRALRELVDPSRPIALNFIFTTCTTICPVMSAYFRGMVGELGEDRGDLRLVSITIDPEFDTPAVLREYAERFGADPDWEFLTGTLEDVVAVERALDAFTGSKANHRPLTFFKAKGSDSWVRIEGLANARDLAREYRELMP